jgi:hypothetical protein
MAQPPRRHQRQHYEADDPEGQDTVEDGLVQATRGFRCCGFRALSGHGLCPRLPGVSRPGRRATFSFGRVGGDVEGVGVLDDVAVYGCDAPLDPVGTLGKILKRLV